MTRKEIKNQTIFFRDLMSILLFKVLPKYCAQSTYTKYDTAQK